MKNATKKNWLLELRERTEEIEPQSKSWVEAIENWKKQTQRAYFSLAILSEMAEENHKTRCEIERGRTNKSGTVELFQT